MSRRLSLLCVLTLPILTSVQAKEPVRWITATVLHAQYRFDQSAGVADRSGTTTARGEFDFDAGSVVYTAEEWVAPRARLVLSEGDTVQLAADKKTLLLRLSDQKVRKLKLLSSYPKKQK